MWPEQLATMVHSRFELLRFLKFLELRERRRLQHQDGDVITKQQHAEAIAALRR